MKLKSDAPSGTGVALKTLVGFFAITIFAAALGGYIGRHSTPPQPNVSADAAPAPAAPAATQPKNP
jgi:hypothetical protein